MSGIGGKVRDQFIKRFAARQGASVLGRALPFGIGAAVGGLGNHALGKKVVQASPRGLRTATAALPRRPRDEADATKERGRGAKDRAAGDGRTDEKERRALRRRRKERDDEDLWADTPHRDPSTIATVPDGRG